MAIKTSIYVKVGNSATKVGLFLWFLLHLLHLYVYSTQLSWKVDLK